MINRDCEKYPVGKSLNIKIDKQMSPKYSVGGIRLKILAEISRYNHNDNDNPLGYKKAALVDLYKELFG